MQPPLAIYSKAAGSFADKGPMPYKEDNRAGSIWWKRIAAFTDAIHLAIIIPIMLTAAAWASPLIFMPFTAGVLFSQALFRGCPMVHFAEHLRDRYNPNREGRAKGSLTVYLYSRHHRITAFAISAGIVILTNVIVILAFV